jgi:uncharacterized RDD family membrane protein YckC
MSPDALVEQHELVGFGASQTPLPASQMSQSIPLRLMNRHECLYVHLSSNRFRLEGVSLMTGSKARNAPRLAGKEGGTLSQLVTGEAVVLQVRIARMPTRALACAIDVVIQSIVLGILLTTLFGFLIGGASEALGVALVFVVLLLVLVGYRVVMETLTRGRTLGKLMLGLKVVRDDGSSIRFRHALVRTLLWIFVDFAPWFAGSPGIVASLMNKQGKRIGDIVAGTVVIRERHQPMASPPLFVPGHLVQWAQSL